MCEVGVRGGTCLLTGRRDCLWVVQFTADCVDWLVRVLVSFLPFSFLFRRELTFKDAIPTTAAAEESPEPLSEAPDEDSERAGRDLLWEQACGPLTEGPGMLAGEKVSGRRRRSGSRKEWRWWQQKSLLESLVCCIEGTKSNCDSNRSPLKYRSRVFPPNRSVFSTFYRKPAGITFRIRNSKVKWPLVTSVRVRGLVLDLGESSVAGAQLNGQKGLETGTQPQKSPPRWASTLGPIRVPRRHRPACVTGGTPAYVNTDLTFEQRKTVYKRTLVLSPWLLPDF